MLAGAAHTGHDPAALLAAVGIAADCLADDAARIPLADYAALYNHVNAVLDDEAFGLFAAPMRVGCFEFLCRATITAPQLGEALARAIRFLRALLPDMEIGIVRDGDSALLTIAEGQPLVVGRVFAYEWLLRLLHGLSCWLVGRGIALDAVDFPYPRPAHADDYAQIYTANSRFDAPRLAARIAGNLLELPIRRDEAALQRFLDGAPGKLTMLYRNDRELVMRVRDHLRAALPEVPELEATAAALRLTPRTLNRRLEEEGSSFRAIKDALRRDLALSRIAKTAQPVADLAADLGYADPSAFYRAFVGWTGVSPSAYRRRLRDG
ncbi:AraC family transcriptional regulator [Azospira restricta]|uniref:AraC family transcriptional regulator n=1 Tax=Azospira restricta TaxID=404405 RepID=A0A974SSJ1_9RHOO|nr:AraC family transcriptional regulator [Azospira restricta]QRJ65647.1 AraC family transcriptional regulator [Azospira restricta]